MNEDVLGNLTGKDIKELEAYTGKSFIQIAEGFEHGSTGITELIYISYLSERKDNPEITVEEVENRPLLELTARFHNSEEKAAKPTRAGHRGLNRRRRHSAKRN